MATVVLFFTTLFKLIVLIAIIFLKLIKVILMSSLPPPLMWEKSQDEELNLRATNRNDRR